jgi:hypothetical protein
LLFVWLSSKSILNFTPFEINDLFRLKAAMKKAGEVSAKDGNITTATDDEDTWKKEFAAFKAASRKTSEFFFEKLLN